MNGKFLTNPRDYRDPNALPDELRKIVERVPLSAEARDLIEHAADELEKLQKASPAT